jgi:uncharacterized protein YjiS (DUF1127 family)
MFTQIKAAWRSLAAHFADWRSRQRAYAELSALDDRSLADIGITRGEIPFLLTQTATPVPDRTRTPRDTRENSFRHAA